MDNRLRSAEREHTANPTAETLARFEKSLTADSAFENSSHRAKFGDALARRTASHPTSCDELGSIFAYDPDEDTSD